MNIPLLICLQNFEPLVIPAFVVVVAKQESLK
jgi:ureidoglycolate hydrolase